MFYLFNSILHIHQEIKFTDAKKQPMKAKSGNRNIKRTDNHKNP